ncbi:MAG: copper chaperone PCu(A)C [Rickettsiaceae bacterium]|nr:copper chaperone PCu(A)C [Rickettsiaceae bacterium]
MIKKIICVMVLSALAVCSFASSGSQNSTVKLAITGAWARSSLAPNLNSAVYMLVKNTNNKEYVIIGASAPLIANRVELHDSYLDEQKISRMRNVDKVVVPAQSSLELKPGGTHIMLMDLKQELKTGDKFTIKLKIENVGVIDVEVEVK